MSAELLQVDGLVSGYGPVTVVHGIDLGLAAGQVSALLGSNGAGKTTTLKTLAGLLPAFGGRIRFDGEDITHIGPDDRVARGLILVPEGRLIFPAMTVEENLRVGGYTPRVRGRVQRNLDRTYAMFPVLRERRRQSAGTLSGGEQQMLALGRGLMAEPRLLLLDEPTLGLAPIMVRKIFDFVAAFREMGVTVLLSEQDVQRTLTLAAKVYLLENGRVALSGTGETLAHDPRVREAYLGI